MFIYSGSITGFSLERCLSQKESGGIKWGFPQSQYPEALSPKINIWPLCFSISKHSRQKQALFSLMHSHLYTTLKSIYCFGIYRYGRSLSCLFLARNSLGENSSEYLSQIRNHSNARLSLWWTPLIFCSTMVVILDSYLRYISLLRDC